MGQEIFEQAVKDGLLKKDADGFYNVVRKPVKAAPKPKSKVKLKVAGDLSKDDE